MKYWIEMLKRFLLWIGAAVLLLTLAACQPKGKEAAAFQTGMKSDTLLTLASEGTDAPLDVPDRLTASAQSADGSVVLKADADIVILGNGIHPISRVEGVDFSQETVDRFIETVLPGVALHNVRTVRIKEDVQEHIDRHKAKRDRYEQMGMLERYERRLAELEQELDAAPESVSEPPYDGKLHAMVHDYGAFTTNYQGLYIGELTKDLGKGRYLRVANNDDMTEPFDNGTDSMPVTKCAELSYFDNRDGQMLDTGYNEIRDVTGETTVDAMAQGYLAMTPAAAQDAVNTLLQELGVDAFAIRATLLGFNFCLI